MKGRARQSGMSLMEMTVAVAIVAMLVAFSGPAIRTLSHSLVSSGDAKAMLSAALASARAIAAKEQRYAGIRFQKAYDPNNLTGAAQYMIFIVQDPNLFDHSGYQVAYGFRAIKGLEPIKLSEGVGVMDLLKNDNTKLADIVSDTDIIDTTTFSIIFSPSGKLVIHDVQVLRKNDYDTVFNEPASSVNPMFKDDYYSTSPFKKEPSRNSFIIYEKNKFDSVNKNSRWDDYLKELKEHEEIFINPYTGTMIEK
jgi:prepilin-type N-terminal cleavage/methylation domain-containing protein